MAEKEYVEREAVTEKLSHLRDKCGIDEMAFALNWALRLMNDIPAADVEPVRHGRWIVYEVANTDEEQPIAWECSECGEVVEAKHNYCPNCGAKMDGRADNG